MSVESLTHFVLSLLVSLTLGLNIASFDLNIQVENKSTNPSTGEIETVKTEVKKIIGAVLTSYNMSFGSGIVVMEQAQLQAAGIDDELK